MFNLELLDKEKLYKIIKIRKEKITSNYEDFRIWEQRAKGGYTYDDIVQMLNDGTIYNPEGLEECAPKCLYTNEGFLIGDLRICDPSDIITINQPFNKLYVLNNEIIISYILNDIGKVVRAHSTIGAKTERCLCKYDDIGRQIECEMSYCIAGLPEKRSVLTTTYSEDKLRSISKWEIDKNKWREEAFWYSKYDRSHATVFLNDEFNEFRLWRYDTNVNEFTSISYMDN